MLCQVDKFSWSSAKQIRMQSSGGAPGKFTIRAGGTGERSGRVVLQLVKLKAEHVQRGTWELGSHFNKLLNTVRLKRVKFQGGGELEATTWLLQTFGRHMWIKFVAYFTAIFVSYLP